MDPVVCWPKHEVTDPRDASTAPPAPITWQASPHNIHLINFSGQAPKHELSSQRHRHPECGNPYSHHSVEGSCELHNLMQGVLRWGTDYGQTQLGPLSYRRISSSTRCSHCPLSLFPLLSQPSLEVLLRLRPRPGMQPQVCP
jgi:hypothetical protein